MPATYPIKTDEENDNETAPYHEQEAFSSMFDALRWKHIRKRIPICFKKSLHNRYMLANLIYLGYTISLLIIDFHPDFNSTSSDNSNEILESNQSISILDQPVIMSDYGNKIYIGK